MPRGRKKAPSSSSPPNRYGEQPPVAKVYLPPKDPWMPPEYEEAEIQAIKALCEGRAGPDQQRLAVKWIVYAAANYGDIDFRPGGSDGERASAFNSGRRFVAAQILKLRDINMAALRRKEQ